jgi:hypothetical protein
LFARIVVERRRSPQLGFLYHRYGNPLQSNLDNEDRTTKTFTELTQGSIPTSSILTKLTLGQALWNGGMPVKRDVGAPAKAWRLGNQGHHAFANGEGTNQCSCFGTHGASSYSPDPSYSPEPSTPSRARVNCFVFVFFGEKPPKK